MALNDRVATALRSDVGQVRANNEDAIQEDADIGLLILADGMGGHNAGEVASDIAVSTTLDVVRREWRKLKHVAHDPANGFSNEALLLKRALEAAHDSIYQVAQSQPECAGMGTTAVACLLHDNSISIAYVGDSRLYLQREGHLEQITRDHSLIEEMVAMGRYSRAEAGQRVRRNVMTRALGVAPDVEVDLIEEPLEVGDLVLLCSDGLTEMLDDRQISLTLDEFADDLSVAADVLVFRANAAGGRDNISVALARIDAAFPRRRPWYGRISEWF